MFVQKVLAVIEKFLKPADFVSITQIDLVTLLELQRKKSLLKDNREFYNWFGCILEAAWCMIHIPTK